MSKFVIICLVAVVAVASARGLSGDNSESKSNEITTQQEGRLLLDVPIVSSIILSSLKAGWFLVTSLCSLIDFKVAAVALVTKAGLWALSYKFPVLVGAVLMLGFCKLTGLCAFHSTHVVEDPDHLAYAVDHLDIGTYKYGKSS